MENFNPNSNWGEDMPEDAYDSRADIEFVQDIPLRETPPAPPPPPEEQPPADKTVLELYGWVQAVISTIVIVVLLFTFVVRIISVDGSSMYPTLYHGDRLLILNDILTSDYEYGDIVVLRKLQFDKKAIVKRVIATPGQTVDIDFAAGQVYVDGQALDEPYVYSPTNISYDVTFPVTVPEGCIFVMGDNRNHSADSRLSTIGMVDTRYVIGKAFLLCFPGPGEYEFKAGGMAFSRLGLLNYQEDANG